LQDSKTASAKYNLKVAKPIFSVPSGTYDSAKIVSISCATPGAEIHYTTDVTEPTETSTKYTEPITLNVRTTIKAKGFKTGWAPSSTAIATYTIGVPPPPIRMVYVPGGTIYPGSGHYTNGLTVSGFYIGKYELTQAEYAAVMGSNPSLFGGNPKHPVEQVSWFDAIEYCNRRSILEGLTPCYSYLDYGSNPDNWPAGWNANSENHINVSCNWNAIGYRLPTEEEWEFAARGGLHTHGYTYSGSNDINEVAWHEGNNSLFGTKQVGTKRPNELRIYDMSGNVWEWCWDVYSGSIRVNRGGSCYSSADYCTVSRRNGDYAELSYFAIGFRVCRTFP